MSAATVKFPVGPRLSPADRQSLVDAVEEWMGIILERADHGQISIRIDLKDRKVLGIRSGGEVSRRMDEPDR